MKRLYVLMLVGVAIVAVLGVGFTGYMVMDIGPDEEVVDKPYESEVIETGTKTVCAEGDLVKVYDVKVDGIVKMWNFVEEKAGPVEIKASFSSPKGYECFAQ